MDEELKKQLSLAIRDKAAEIFDDFPDTHPQNIFNAMPQLYKHVKEELKLLPEGISFEQFHQAAAMQFEVMQNLARHGMF